MLGLGWYGRSFKLAEPGCNIPNGRCRFSEGAAAGECTDSIGTLSNAEIFRVIKSTGVSKSFDRSAGVKWITWNRDQWVSFDDGETMQLKVDLANSQCLSGTMIWAIDQDNTEGDSMNDLLGIGPANGITPAKAAAFKAQLQDAHLQQAIGSSCYWTFCGEQCKAGFFPTTSGKGQVAGIQRSSVCTGDQFQTLCCAPGTIVGTCSWQGFRGIGLPCTPTCEDTTDIIVARNTNSYQESPEGQLLDLTCTGK